MQQQIEQLKKTVIERDDTIKAQTERIEGLEEETGGEIEVVPVEKIGDKRDRAEADEGPKLENRPEEKGEPHTDVKADVYFRGD